MENKVTAKIFHVEFQVPQHSHFCQFSVYILCVHCMQIVAKIHVSVPYATHGCQSLD